MQVSTPFIRRVLISLYVANITTFWNFPCIYLYIQTTPTAGDSDVQLSIDTDWLLWNSQSFWWSKTYVCLTTTCVVWLSPCWFMQNGQAYPFRTWPHLAIDKTYSRLRALPTEIRLTTIVSPTNIYVVSLRRGGLTYTLYILPMTSVYKNGGEVGLASLARQPLHSALRLLRNCVIAVARTVGAGARD